MERSLEQLRRRYPSARFSHVYNPFYNVADNLATCWMARHEMAADCTPARRSLQAASRTAFASNGVFSSPLNSYPPGS